MMENQIWCKTLVLVKDLHQTGVFGGITSDISDALLCYIKANAFSFPGHTDAEGTTDFSTHWWAGECLTPVKTRYGVILHKLGKDGSNFYRWQYHNYSPCVHWMHLNLYSKSFNKLVLLNTCWIKTFYTYLMPWLLMSRRRKWVQLSHNGSPFHAKTL